MPTSTPTQTLFITQVMQMLSFWRQKTGHIDHEKIRWLETERQNLFHAVKIGLRYPETMAETAVILSQAIPYIIQRGYWQDWIPLLEQCLANKICQNASRRIHVLISLGQAYREDNQLDKAIATHLESRQLAETTKQNDMLAQIQYEMTEDYWLLKAYEEAITSGQAAINLLEQQNSSESLLANCYKMLGNIFRKTGETNTAEKHYTKAIAMWRKIGNPVHIARSLNDFSVLLLASKRYDEAEKFLSEAESLLVPTINELDKCLIYVNLGSVYAAQQQWEIAATVFYKANSPYLRQSMHLSRKAQVNNNLGYVLFRQEKYEAAEEYLQQALQLWQEMGADLEYANTLSTFADSLLAWHGVNTALPFYDELLQLLANYPQSSYANNLQNEYTVVREQAIKKVM